MLAFRWTMSDRTMKVAVEAPWGCGPGDDGQKRLALAPTDCPSVLRPMCRDRFDPTELAMAESVCDYLLRFLMCRNLTCVPAAAQPAVSSNVAPHRQLDEQE